MNILNIELPSETSNIPEIIKETIIPNDYNLLYTHEPSSQDILNNLPIFQIYEHEEQKYLALLGYKDRKYHPYHLELLENVIGTSTKVTIHGINGDKPIDAKLDTGADVCSLNAQNVQIDDKSNQVLFNAFGKRYRMMLASKQNIQTADHGSELRPVVKMSIKINDKVVNDVMVNLNDRGNMADFLIGMNCIKNLNMKIDPNLKEYVEASQQLLEMSFNILKPFNDSAFYDYYTFLEKDGKHIGDQSGIEIIKVEYNNELFYGAKLNNIVVGFATFKVLDNATWELGLVHTLPEYRGKAIAKNLLWFIKNQEGKKILDSGAQTADGINLMKKLDTTDRFDLYWYNVKSHEKVKYDGASDSFKNFPYRSNQTKTDWRVLIESDNSPSFERFDDGLVKGIVEVF